MQKFCKLENESFNEISILSLTLVGLVVQWKAL